MEKLMEAIGYKFKDESCLLTALTHSSYANEHRNTYNNERLEFLGDSVLSIIVSQHLFSNYRGKKEGDLTKLRASLVCEETLATFARRLNLGKYMRFGKGEKNSGGGERPSILADAFEALIAAIFLDGGMEEARRFVLSFIIDELDKTHSANKADYKTSLQEIVQQSGEEKLEYVLVAESGPDHNKRFTTEVYINSNKVGRGSGRSKKEAEQNAAHEALKLLGY